MRTNRWVGVIVLAATAACSSSPTSPSGASTSVTVSTPAASSWTLAGQVVPTHGPVLPGVAIDYASLSTQTDGNGRFTLTHQHASGASSMTLTHPGLLERRLWVRGGASRSDLAVDPIALAPPFDLTFYRKFVRNALDAPGSLRPVSRLAAAPKFYIQTNDDFGQAVDGDTLQSIRASIVLGVTQFTPYGVPLIEQGPEPREAERGWIRVLIKQWTASFTAGGTCGQAFVGADPGEIRLWLDRCRCPGEHSRIGQGLVVHEVGHALGFWHVDGRHVMQPIVACGAVDVIASPEERFHAAIAYRRPVGNQDPDHDPSHVFASTADFAAPPVLLSCGG
ncbi:MAG: M12 family metallopeptidase [Vicinamibacterales bacterium]|nr:M12 family metallopeptidase [Vicinamibacterales bacterium]